MTSDRSEVLSRVRIVAVFLATWVLTFTLATWALSSNAGAQEQSPAGDISFEDEDMIFILKQIEIAERHAAGERLVDILPNNTVPWGLRTVDGSYNNLLPGQENFGRADEVFPNSVTRKFRPADDGTSYDSGETVQDNSPRLISHLIVNQSTDNPAATAAFAAEEGENIGPDIAGADQYFIPNTAPDEGLSAPINAYMTFFGQFFDHGLDLIEKGKNGFVIIPIPEDDPLFTPGAATNFMVIDRATRMPGPDGVQGTNDDVPNFVNRTTPHVDQQQTYGSHSSAQVLLREYELRAGRPEDTGGLLNGFGNDRTLDTSDDGGLTTWDTARAQARAKLGIDLDDRDGSNIPLILADPYGNFIPGDNGLPQLITGSNEDGTPILLEGDLGTPVDASLALRIDHDFFIDVSHSANPKNVRTGEFRDADPDTVINARIDTLSGQPTRGIRANGPAGTYDNELLGMHFVCGDGRCNENIALTSIHHLFHSEHNRLTYQVKRVALERGNLDFLNEWLDTPVTQEQLDSWTALPFPKTDASQDHQLATKVAIDALDFDWNGKRVFQAARFGTEMQYNRIVFDEFGPSLAGLKDAFEGYHTSVDATITSEFSQTVYRFGHSMLTETVDRYDADFNTIVDPVTGSGEQLGLFEAFLNPLAFYNSDADGNATLSPEEAAGAVIRGITRTVANEIDEFVTGGLQNNLLGLPLDLGAINIARGRDVGNPSLNEARRLFYSVTQSERLKPYVHWVDYGDNVRHEESLVNFVAAYGTHPSIVATDTYAGRRAAACAIVGALTGNAEVYCVAAGFTAAPIPATPVDAIDFLFSRGDWATGADGTSKTGVDDIDFWNGGLAEERQPFGGYLGSTHNFVFENQIERLQNGDRFYYLGRTMSIPMLTSLESNSFTSLIMRNTDLGAFGGGTLPLSSFHVANYIWEVDQEQQFDPELGTADPEPESLLFPFVIRDAARATTNIEVPDPTRFLQTTGGDHFTIGGTSGRDTIIGGIGDDSIWGREGDDRLEGGDGADSIEGGPGDDIITDLAGPDVIEGGDGHDAIASGNEEDVIFGDAGNDFIVNASELGEIFAGPGDDYILDGIHISVIRGGGGDDWMEELGGGENLWQGDGGALEEFGASGLKGNDVFMPHDGNNDADMESGDDIIVDGPGIERAEGMLGFDWISFQNDKSGVDIDTDLTIFDRPILPVSNSTILNRYDRVEGISGSPFGDILRGTENPPGMNAGNELVVTSLYDNFALIEGLSDVIEEGPDGQIVVSRGLIPLAERRELLPDPINGLAQFGWTGGELILGGGGSDLLAGEGGSDIIDGDAALTVGIDTPNPATRSGELAQAVEVAEEALAAATATRADAQTAANLSAAQASADQATADPLNAAAALASSNAEVLSNAAVAALEAQLAANQVAAVAVAQAAATATALETAQASQTAADALAITAAEAVTTTAQAAATAQTAADEAQALADTTATTAGAAQAAASAAEAEADALQSVTVATLVGAFTGQNTFADFLAALDAAEIASDAAAILAAEAAIAQATADAADMANDTAQMTASEANAAADAAVTTAAQATASATAAATAVASAQTAADTAAAAVAPAQAAATEAQAVFTAATQLATDAADAALAANDAANAAQATADASASQAAADQVALDAAVAALQPATDALTAAEDALAAADTRIVVPGMREIMNAIFAGTINPGELAISRIISDQDPENLDTDGVLFAGNRADYSIESDGLGNPADLFGGPDGLGDPDGFIEIVDNSVRADNDGRDLVRNVERLIFRDAIVTIPSGTAGAFAGAAPNTPAEGAIEILGTPEVDMVITASVANVSDADNVTSMGQVDPSGIAFTWQVELAPNSGEFTDLTRVEGIFGNGDVVTARDTELALTVAEAGLRVRIVGIFQDEEGVFEQVSSVPVIVANCPECPIPDALLGLVPANFVGGGAGGFGVGIDGDSVIFENLSRFGRPRIDVTIPRVALDLFENTGFDPILEAGDAVAVDSIELVFTDSDGNETGRFTPQIAAIVDEVTGVVEQGVVNVLFSIRGDEVLGLIVPPQSTASVRVNGVELANAVFLGDSSVDDGQGATLALVNGLTPTMAAGPIANFVGTAGDIAGDTVTFENLSRAGRARFDVTVPGVALDLFANTGFPDPVTAGNEIGVDSFELAFEGVPAAILGTVNGLFSGTIVSIQDEVTLEVDQGAVNVLFSLRDDVVVPLVRGLTRVVLRVNGTEVVDHLFFGDSSLDDATGVSLMLTQAELEAAAALEVAILLGDEEGIAAARAALQTAVDEALANAALPVVAPEPAPGVTPATFDGDAADLEGLAVEFVNNSRPDLARFDITIADINLGLFTLPEAFAVGETPDCGVAGDLSIVCPGDEVAVDSFTAIFTDELGEIIRVFGVDIATVAAQENVDADGIGDGTARQDVAQVLFSIRGEDVAPLVPGIGTVTVAVNGVPLASAALLGDSDANNAQDVAVVTVSSLADGIGAIDTAAVEAAAAAADTVRVVASSGVVDRRGRIRLEGSCQAEAQATAPGLRCNTREDNTYRCDGRGLEPRRRVEVSCLGPASTVPSAPGVEVLPTDPTVAAVGAADERGGVRIAGHCNVGSAVSDTVGVRCSTRRSGDFRCTGRGLAEGREVSISCR